MRGPVHAGRVAGGRIVVCVRAAAGCGLSMLPARRAGGGRPQTGGSRRPVRLEKFNQQLARAASEEAGLGSDSFTEKT